VGGGILHGQELTYSIVCRQEDLGTKDVKTSFELLCQFLIRFYKELGLEAEFAVKSGIPDERLGQKTAFCFAGKEEYDLLIKGRKMGGNAQRRFKDVIFQHGSIPIILNWEGLSAVFLKKDLPHRSEVTCLENELPELPDWFSLQSSLKAAFEQSYKAALIPFEAENRYLNDISDLQRVYQSDEWTLRRVRN
jgi:lipoate-protein ligase A